MLKTQGGFRYQQTAPAGEHSAYTEVRAVDEKRDAQITSPAAGTMDKSKQLVLRKRKQPSCNTASKDQALSQSWTGGCSFQLYLT